MTRPMKNWRPITCEDCGAQSYANRTKADIGNIFGRCWVCGGTMRVGNAIELVDAQDQRRNKPVTRLGNPAIGGSWGTKDDKSNSARIRSGVKPRKGR